MIRFVLLSIFIELAALAAFPLVPLAVLFADNLGRLPRWARWMETQDRPGWLGPPSDTLARLAWTDAQEFRRTSPTLLAMASALSLTDAQLDQLFITAAGIEA